MALKTQVDVLWLGRIGSIISSRIACAKVAQAGLAGARRSICPRIPPAEAGAVIT
jgi:hypothetical protein